MDNVKFEDLENPITKEIVTYAYIDRGNGEFTSMPKSLYDEQQAQAALSTPMVAEE